MTSEKYNGWRNWETWTISLYFGDDTEYIQEMAEESDFSSPEMADLIEAHVWSYIEDVAGKPDGLIGEFVTAGMGEVDWRELAENWLTDCTKPLNEDLSYELVAEIQESAILWTSAESYIQEYGEFGANDIESLCTNDWSVDINTDLENLDWELIAKELNREIDLVSPESV